MSETVKPIDQAARESAIENIEKSTFIAAGAGGGKSTTIVERLVEALLKDSRNLKLENIAAITFTERAGAELRERVRDRLSELLAEKASPKLQASLDTLDSATIGTIHSFAMDILSKYPIEAGLPLEFEILDDSTSKRVISDLARQVLEDFVHTYAPNDELEAFKQDLTVWQLQKLVEGVFKMQHRLDDKYFGQVTLEDPEIEIRKLGLVLERLSSHPDFDSSVLTGAYYQNVAEGFSTFAELLVEGDFSKDGIAKFQEACARLVSGATRSAKNIPFRDAVVDAGVSDELFLRLLGAETEALARELLAHAWKAVRENLEARVSSGNISFDDLLYLAVKLLNEHRDIRESLYSQYKLLIIDEFQDTDPLQWELALLVTTDPAKGLSSPDNGSLVLVGDAQQSIYSFRGAELATFEAARSQFESEFKDSQSLTLEVNFRSTDSILNWVNSCFKVLDMGAAFAPLSPAHENTVGSKLGAAVHVLQGENGSVLSGKDEPQAVASAIRAAVDDNWQVREGKFANSGSRDVKYEDISLLIPTRTTLNKILTALEDQQIPYRSNDAAIVYDRPIVRGLISALRAISGYGVPLDLWFALKSPLFGCTDTELLVYKKSGGRWNIPWDVSEEFIADPVARALNTLAVVRKSNTNAQPSQVFTQLLGVCNVAGSYHQVLRGEFELDCLDMVIQHARKWEQAGGAGLVDYSNWLVETVAENSRERLPEIDDKEDSAVRISTVHAVKGLEFPMVVVAGLGMNRKIEPPLLAVQNNQLEFHLSGSIMSAGYRARMLEEETEKIAQEHLRVLYVAATRAKDHLVISGARKINKTGFSTTDWGELIVDGLKNSISLGHAVGFSKLLPPIKGSWSHTASASPVDPKWQESLVAVRAAASKKFVQSPSYLHADTDETWQPVTLIDDDSVADSAVSDEPALAGTDVAKLGTLLHEIMEEVVLYRIDQTPDVLSSKISLGVKEIEMPEHEARLTSMIKATIASEYIQRAFVASSVWPELSMFASSGEVDDVITEGFADLVFEDEKGIVLLDYKTNIELTEEKIAKYRAQLGAYADLIQSASAQEVAEQVLLHVRQNSAEAVLL